MHRTTSPLQYPTETAAGTAEAVGQKFRLDSRNLAPICSGKCVPDIVLKAYDFGRVVRGSDVAIVSGFHSPMERTAFLSSCEVQSISSSFKRTGSAHSVFRWNGKKPSTLEGCFCCLHLDMEKLSAKTHNLLIRGCNARKNDQLPAIAITVA
jgi:hypothetical protein